MYSLLNAVSLTIEVRNLQCVSGEISGVKIWQPGLFNSQRDGNDARTGAKIGYKRCASSMKHMSNGTQCGLDQSRCYRARNQYPIINKKIKAVKLYMTNEIGDRFTLPDSLQELKKPLFLSRLKFNVRIEGFSFNSECMSKQ